MSFSFLEFPVWYFQTGVSLRELRPPLLWAALPKKLRRNTEMSFFPGWGTLAAPRPRALTTGVKEMWIRNRRSWHSNIKSACVSV